MNSKLIQVGTRQCVLFDRLGNFTPASAIKKKKKRKREKKEKLALQNTKTFLERVWNVEGNVENFGGSYDTKDASGLYLSDRANWGNGGTKTRYVARAWPVVEHFLQRPGGNIYGQYEVAWSCKILDLFRRPGIIQNPCSCDCSR